MHHVWFQPLFIFIHIIILENTAVVGLSVINPTSALLLLSSSDDDCCYTVIYMEWKECAAHSRTDATDTFRWQSWNASYVGWGTTILNLVVQDLWTFVLVCLSLPITWWGWAVAMHWLLYDWERDPLYSPQEAGLDPSLVWMVLRRKYLLPHLGSNTKTSSLPGVATPTTLPWHWRLCLHFKYYKLANKV